MGNRNSKEKNKHEHDHHHHKGHSHDVSGVSGRKIFWVTILNAVITIVEVFGGILSGSLALLSDSLHNLNDTVSIALSYVANKISQRPKNPEKTFGYKRAEILAAFINSSVLFLVSFWLIFKSYERFQNPETINSNLMLVVATIGLIANFLSVYLLEKDARDNINIRSSYLHLINDTVSSIGVIIGGLAIKFWGITWIDPLITVLMALFILKETWDILKTSIDIFMQTSPNLDYDNIKKDIENIEGIENIHHIHAWMLNEKTSHFEAHIAVKNMDILEIEEKYMKIEKILREKYKINHVTIQPEVDKCIDKEMF
ncbi:MAG: cation diffusion facilitator family transporter [Fusobacteriota bacterium]